MRPGRPAFLARARGPALALPLRPLDLVGSKLILDLDSRYVSLGIGTKIGQWRDQSSYGHHGIQGTLLNQPAHQLPVAGLTFDGKPAVRFTNITNTTYFDGAIAPGLLNVGDTPYLYVVTRTWQTGGYSHPAFGLISISADGTAATEIRLGKTTGYSMSMNGTDYVASISPNNSFYYAWPMEMMGRFAAAKMHLELSWFQLPSTHHPNPWNANVDAPTGLLNALTQFTVGRSFAGIGGRMDVFRILVVNPAPTPEQHIAIRNCLRREYPSFIATAS